MALKPFFAFLTLLSVGSLRGSIAQNPNAFSVAQFTVSTGTRTYPCDVAIRRFANTTGLRLLDCSRKSQLSDVVVVKYNMTDQFITQCSRQSPSISSPPPSISSPPPNPISSPPPELSPPPPVASPPPTVSPPLPVYTSVAGNNSLSFYVINATGWNLPTQTICAVVNVTLLTYIPGNAIHTFSCYQNVWGVLNVYVSTVLPIPISSAVFDSLAYYTSMSCGSTIFASDASTTNVQVYNCNNIQRLCCRG